MSQIVTLAAEGGYQVFNLAGGEWFWLILSACTAILAIVIGFVLRQGVLGAEAGTPAMIEIARSIQVGARAYLDRPGDLDHRRGALFGPEHSLTEDEADHDGEDRRAGGEDQPEPLATRQVEDLVAALGCERDDLRHLVYGLLPPGPLPSGRRSPAGRLLRVPVPARLVQV